MPKLTIGMLGLGAMGAPMAERLLDAGYPVVSAPHRNREPFDRLGPKGLHEVDGPAAVGAASDLLCSLVFDEAQNDAVLRGPDGALAAMRPGSTVLLMSTISPGYCRDLAAEARKRDIQVLDCPLSGQPAGAEAGTLTLMLGGPEEAIANARESLAVLGTVAHCGEVGAGQVMKLANNAMAIGTWAMLMEVRDMVAATGMDLERFMAILNQSTGRSFVSEHFPFPPVRVSFPAMPRKDLALCLDVGRDRSVEMPIVEGILRAGTSSEG